MTPRCKLSAAAVLLTAFAATAAVADIPPPPGESERALAAIITAAGYKCDPSVRYFFADEDAAGPYNARGLSAVITQVMVVPAAAVTAPARRPVGEFLRVLGAHVPHGHEDDHQDYHDNDGQDDHELCHRTIQQAWPYGAVQARHTRPLTRAFLVCASTLDLNPC